MSKKVWFIGVGVLIIIAIFLIIFNIKNNIADLQDTTTDTTNSNDAQSLGQNDSLAPEDIMQQNVQDPVAEDIPADSQDTSQNTPNPVTVTLSVEDQGDQMEFTANIEGDIYATSYYNGVANGYVPIFSWQIYKFVNNEWEALLIEPIVCPPSSCSLSCDEGFPCAAGASQSYWYLFNDKVSYDWNKIDNRVTTQTCPTFTRPCLNQGSASGTYKVSFSYRTDCSPNANPEAQGQGMYRYYRCGEAMPQPIITAEKEFTI